jgi:hypothetical protein
MTPAEVNGRIRALGAERSAKNEQLDLLAWMIGRYAAKGYHEPGKYPRKPEIIDTKQSIPSDEMDEDSMKTILTAYAEVHNTVEGAK